MAGSSSNNILEYGYRLCWKSSVGSGTQSALDRGDYIFITSSSKIGSLHRKNASLKNKHGQLRKVGAKSKQ